MAAADLIAAPAGVASRPLPALIARLQAAGFAVSTAEMLDAARLLARLAESGTCSSPSSGLGMRPGKPVLSLPKWLPLPETPDSSTADDPADFLLRHLRPLLCKTSDAAAQQRFDAVFQDWWDHPPLPPASQPQDDPGPTGDTTTSEPPKPSRRRAVLLGLLLLVSLIWLLQHYYNQHEATTVSAAPITEPKPAQPAQPPKPDPAARSQPPPRTERIYGYWPAYRYTETLRPGLAWLLVGAPLSLLLFFHLPAWALGRRRGGGGAGIRLDGWDHDKAARRLVPPLAAGVADCLDRHLRGPADEIRRLARRPPLDIRRTVAATLAHLGIPQLRYRHARLRPEYLLLVEAGDDSALPMLWAERLRKQGVAVDLRRLIVPQDGGPPTWRNRHGETGPLNRLPDPGYGQRLMLWCPTAPFCWMKTANGGPGYARRGWNAGRCARCFPPRNRATCSAAGWHCWIAASPPATPVFWCCPRKNPPWPPGASGWPAARCQ
jgi:hypothetical protein